MSFFGTRMTWIVLINGNKMIESATCKDFLQVEIMDW